MTGAVICFQYPHGLRLRSHKEYIKYLQGPNTPFASRLPI